VELHYHRASIVTFFTEYHTQNNLKLKNVLADAQSDEIDQFNHFVSQDYGTILAACEEQCRIFGLSPVCGKNA
jgi:CRISPR/Cas system-associated endonuclease Cas1